MAVAEVLPADTRVSVDDYLNTSFEGVDREYVDGVIVERSMPKRSHSFACRALIVAFGARRKACGVDGYGEQRLRLAPNKVRVPDFCAFRTRRRDEVPADPPMVIAEVVSPSDVHSNLIAKLTEYRSWGVEHVWLIDPQMQRLAVYRESGLDYVDELSLPEVGARLRAEDLFDIA